MLSSQTKVQAEDSLAELDANQLSDRIMYVLFFSVIEKMTRVNNK